MKKILLILFIVSLASIFLKAQQPVKLVTVDSSASNTSFVKIAGGYLMSTVKSGSAGPVSTIIKTDSAGNPLLAKRINESIASIVPCADSGYLLLPSFSNIFIKTDNALNIQWAKKMSNPFPFSWLTQAVEKDGYYYLVSNVLSGLVDSTLSVYSTNAAVIYRLDAGGNLLKTCILADTVYSQNRYGFQSPSLSVSNDGSLYLGGALLPYWAAGTCNREPVVAKLDTALNLQWSYIYYINSYCDVRGINLFHDGNIALYGGYSNNTFNCLNFVPYLQKIDTAGNILFAKDYHHSFSTSHTTYQLLELADSALLFSRSYNDIALGHNVAYLDLIGATGNIIHSKSFDWPSPFGIVALRMADAGNGSVQLVRLNNTDTLLFTGVDTSLTTFCNSLPNVIFDSTIVITRSVYSPVNLNYSFIFIDTIYQPFYPVPYSMLNGCVAVGIEKPATQDNVNVFPNPTSGNVTVNSSHLITELKITNAHGQLVYHEKPNDLIFALKLLDKGIYFINITTANERVTKKLLVIY